MNATLALLRLTAVLVLGLALAACGDTGQVSDVGRVETGVNASATAKAAASAADRAEVAAMCEAVRDLHSDLIERANTMASLEVDASPAERAAILNHGLSDIIAIGEVAALPNQPASLTDGLEQRRQEVIAELRIEEDELLNKWETIDQADRAGAVNRVFLLTEKLMSETEPKVSANTPDALMVAAQETESCRFVMQLPPSG